MSKAPEALLQLFLAGLSIAVAILGGLGPGPFDFLVPQVGEFFTAIWTTVFVAVIGVVVLNATRGHRRGPGDLFDIAKREVPYELEEYARQKGKEYGADENLVLAILYTENLQRPRWYRTIENIKGRVFPRGTYGIMQVRSDHPLNDKESIDLAIERHLKGVHVPTDPQHGGGDREQLHAALQAYNDNPAFVELAIGMYDRLKSGY